jgi:hypothetical protein
MRGLGFMLVGLLNFPAGQMTAERQSEHLPVTFLRRGRSLTLLPLAEARGGEEDQGVANEAEAPPRGVLDFSVRIFERRLAQARQRLHGRLPQDRLLAVSRYVGRKARGFAIVGRGRQPNPLNTEFPFRKLSIHGATAIQRTGKAFRFRPRKFELVCIENSKPEA